MKLLAASERDVTFCRRTCTVAVWLQLAMGLFMTWRWLISPVYGVMTIYTLLLVIVARYLWNIKAVRVSARVLTAVVWVLGAAYLAILLGKFVYPDQVKYSEQMCVFCTPVLSMAMPAFAAISLRGGRYDKVLACLSQAWTLLCVALATLGPIREVFPWVWDHGIPRVLWLGITLAATAMLLCCAVMRQRKEEPEDDESYKIL